MNVDHRDDYGLKFVLLHNKYFLDD